MPVAYEGMKGCHCGGGIVQGWNKKSNSINKNYFSYMKVTCPFANRQAL